MKYLLMMTFTFFVMTGSFAQQLQLHYDLRHTIAPGFNKRNFATLYFEYFKNQDSGKGLIKPGSVLIKMQADFAGQTNNLSKFYMQVSQSFRFWQPKIFVNFQYSGGMGITEPKEYSYYINNNFAAGLSYPFKWGKSYLTTQLYYQVTTYKKPSHDLLYTLYWWKGLFDYKAEFAGDFSVYTFNKNKGDNYTKDLHGKTIGFFAEPQFWYNISSKFSAGSKLNTYYHVNTSKNLFQFYPSIAVRYKF